ncbi:nicotinate-nucleotide adenylyltransferase [Candidatus Acetothermia bacterium]|jgi:nicotinate-nucleotide adenylyltransferase|nr:nicotinate-nucleotide adenylyltransferase [Candidatus Acetothermia bacterium]MCI2428591.1 nicotinate-nucleotide adenylyltransferase [Candidatus Acetothermia bacterium]
MVVPDREMSPLYNRVGLFGGTFNPVHNAHIVIAERALTQFALAKVIFIPSGHPPHKQIIERATAHCRYEMVRRALIGYPHFEVSRVEIDRPGPSYTIDTINSMKELYPQGVCFIVGADLFKKIETWKDPEDLITSCPFILAPRNGIKKEEFERLPFSRGEIYFLDIEEMELSSSIVRETYRKRENIDGLVPAGVAAYIEEKDIYR